MVTNQEGRYISLLEIAGISVATYNEAVIAANLANGGTATNVNSAWIELLQSATGSTSTNLSDLQALYATENGFSSWNEVNEVIAGFSPLNIEGLVLFLDEQSLKWEDTNFATIPADPDVGRWSDRSAEQNNALQTTVADKPHEVNDTGYTGLDNVVLFDGDDDNMLLDSDLFSVPADDNTVFIVYQSESTTKNQRLIAGTTTGTRWGVTINGDLATPTIDVINHSSATPAQFTKVLDNKPHIVGFNRSGATITGFFDDDTVSGSAADVTLTYGVLGAYSTSALPSVQSNHFAGHIYAVLVYNRSLDAEEQQRVYDYLYERYFPAEDERPYFSRYPTYLPYIREIEPNVAEFTVADLTVANYTHSNANVRAKFEYLNFMYVGIDSPNGFSLGFFPDVGGPYSMTGSTSGLAIDSTTGEITVSDTSLITSAGSRAVTIGTAIGDFDITIPVVSGAETGVNTTFFYDYENGDDSNSGRQPHIPKQNVPTQAEGGTYGIRCFKRGSTFVGRSLIFANLMKIRCYGNPRDPQPTITDNGTGSFDGAYKNASNVTIPFTTTNVSESYRKNTGTYQNTGTWEMKFIDLEGGRRHMYAYNATDMTVVGVKLKNTTTNDANSSGFYLNTIGGAVALLWCETENVAGDAFYIIDCGNSAGTRRVLIDFFYSGSTTGGAADNGQISNENSSGNDSFDVVIRNSIAVRSIASTSTKGAFAIAGCSRVSMHDCYIPGGYFCLSGGGNNNEFYNLYGPFGYLPGNTNTALVGFINEFDMSNNEISDCTLMHGETTFTLSKATAGVVARDDLYFFRNNCLNSAKAARVTEESTGLVDYNIFANNVDNDVNYSSGLAPEDAITIGANNRFQDNFVALPLDLPQPTIAGTLEPGQTLTVTIPTLPSGISSATPYWSKNGVVIPGENGTTFDIPQTFGNELPTRGAIQDHYGKARIHCAVLYETAHGDQTWASATFGEPYHHRAPIDSFYPDDLAETLTFWDGTDSATLWEDTAGTTPATTAIGRWDDKGSAGANLTSATNKPDIGSMNSLGAVAFNGANDQLLNSSLDVSSFGTGNFALIVSGNLDTLGSRRDIFSLSDGIVGGDNLGIFVNASNVLQGFLRRNGGTALSLTGSGTVSATTDYVFSLVRASGGAATLRLNGSVIASGTFSDTLAGFTAHPIYVGHNNGANFWDGDIGEFAIGSYSASQVTAIENYMMELRGII